MEGNMSVIPRTNTFEDFNTVLDQSIQYFDANGNTQTGSFYPALQKSSEAAAGLETRVTDLISQFNSGKTTPEMQEAIVKCNEQFNQLKALGVMGTGTAEQLREMKVDLDTNSPAPGSSKAIMSEKDIEVVCGNIDALVYSLTNDYLTGGTFGSYLPDHINTLNGFKA